VTRLRSSLQAVFIGIAAAVFFLGSAAVALAQSEPSPAPSASASPEASAAPPVEPVATPTPAATATPAETLFYDAPGDIFSKTSDGTLYYYFQGNQDGTAKVKQELRLGTTLWNDNAQFRLRLPYITRFPVEGNPYYGLGNIEAGYNYNVTSKTFDHALEFRIALPTASNGVESLDTQIKAFYTTKWKMGWGNVAYTNEYDQTIIQPKGASYTSYYEGKLTLPDYAFKATPGLKFSAFWNYRILVDSGGKFKDALGGSIFGNLGDLALSITDSWGLGNNALWKYKFEANATFKLKT